MNVYIGCFGSGLGHASRMLEVAKELTARGSLVRLSSSGEVVPLIRRRGFECNSLPLADVRYSDTGEFALKQTMLSSPSILARTYQQLAMEISNIERFGPDVVLSDSALSTVIAAKILRLPIYTVLNQLNLNSSHERMGAPSRLLSTGTSAGMGRLWEFSDEVLLPDLPPPYTISERNLWGSNVEKTRYVGFLTSSQQGTPDEAALEFSSETRPRIFWQVSGPPQTRSIFLQTAMKAAEALADDYAFVVSAGSPSAGGRPVRIPGGWYYDWCDIAEHYFRACDAVVSRAGHGTIGQAISCSKPSLLVPIPRQPEQEGNAEKAVRLGVSVCVPQDELTVEQVRRSLKDVLDDDRVNAAMHLGAIAQAFDAKQEIVRTVEAAAHGARPILR